MSDLTPERLAELQRNEQRLGNLLALIHGDGGHYISRYGWERAEADAKERLNDLMVRLGMLIDAAKDRERVLREALAMAEVAIGDALLDAPSGYSNERYRQAYEAVKRANASAQATKPDAEARDANT